LLLLLLLLLGFGFEEGLNSFSKKEKGPFDEEEEEPDVLLFVDAAEFPGS